jgi:hypothetical protein
MPMLSPLHGRLCLSWMASHPAALLFQKLPLELAAEKVTAVSWFDQKPQRQRREGHDQCMEVLAGQTPCEWPSGLPEVGVSLGAVPGIFVSVKSSTEKDSSLRPCSMGESREKIALATDELKQVYSRPLVRYATLPGWALFPRFLMQRWVEQEALRSHQLPAYRERSVRDGLTPFVARPIGHCQVVVAFETTAMWDLLRRRWVVAFETTAIWHLLVL